MSKESNRFNRATMFAIGVELGMLRLRLHGYIGYVYVYGDNDDDK